MLMFVPVTFATEQPGVLFGVRSASTPRLDVGKMPGRPRARRTTIQTLPAIADEYAAAELVQWLSLEPDSAQVAHGHIGAGFGSSDGLRAALEGFAGLHGLNPLAHTTAQSRGGVDGGGGVIRCEAGGNSGKNTNNSGGSMIPRIRVQCWYILTGSLRESAAEPRHSCTAIADAA